MGENLVVVGRVTGPYGVRGWIRVNSYTEPRNNILGYGPWHFERDGVIAKTAAISGRMQGKALIAQIQGIEDREAAAELSGTNILVGREVFAPAASNEYYWQDLIGAKVLTSGGMSLGTVDSLMATGANDVLVVAGERRRLIPFIVGEVVESVDLDAGTIIVDWDPDF